jgi:predicted ester cyclase
VAHTWGPMPQGRDGLKAAIERVSKGLADASMTIEDVIAEGDRVAVRLTSHGRQVGEFMGMPPSGREYTIGEIHIFRVADGKVAEHWHQADFLGMMRQLGAMPGG